MKLGIHDKFNMTEIMGLVFEGSRKIVNMGENVGHKSICFFYVLFRRLFEPYS